MDRRTFLASGLTLGLVGLATGLPPRWLLEGIPTARAAPPRRITPLILSISQRGDPVNANAPGTYVGSVTHPDDPDFGGAAVTFGSQTVTAAAVWGTLPAALRANMAFVHHRTNAVAHSEFDRVMGLSGTVTRREGAGQESLASAIGQETATPLGALQAAPICLGNEIVSFDGAPLARVRPSSIVSLFANQVSVFDELRPLRQRALDRVYADLRTSGTAAQRAFLDELATSSERAQDLGTSLGTLLEDFAADSDEDGPRDQIKTAVALAALRVAPVITLNLPFGGDNHVDPEFGNEIFDTESGVAHIADLWARLDALNLTNDVTLGMLNVFGRRLDQLDGRDHHRNHNVMWVAGPNVRGGVVGGLDAAQNARGFDLATGEPADSGIPATETLPIAGATLMAAAGVPADRLSARIPDIPPISAALRI